MRKFIFLLALLILFSCNNISDKKAMDTTLETITNNDEIERVNEQLDTKKITAQILKSSPFTRMSGDFFGSEALVFDGNTVRFSVASFSVTDGVIDREDINGTYKFNVNSNSIDMQFDFNTNFVFVDYLVDGSRKGGKSIKEVNVPYIIKGTLTNDGYIILKGWENKKQEEEREKREEAETNKEKIVEDFGIDKNTILGMYKSIDNAKGVSINIISIDQKEQTELGKKGVISGTLKVNEIEKEFSTDYETGYNGNRYSFNIDYKEDRGRTYGVLFVFNKIMNANFYSDSGPSKRFELKRIESIQVVEEKNNSSSEVEITYYKVNDPDGYSNLRDKPKGDVIRKVLDDEKFEVISTIDDYKEVKFSDNTKGYIHSSRIIKYN